MRWLALVPYGAFVIAAWIGMGARSGLLLLICFLFLIAALRPTVVGEMIRNGARTLCRTGSPDASVPTLVRGGRAAARRLIRWRDQHAGAAVANAAAAGPPGDDLLVPVLLVDDHPLSAGHRHPPGGTGRRAGDEAGQHPDG